MLVYELNSSGKYFAIKEQLKHSVVKIVREKYLRTTDFENQQELQVRDAFQNIYSAVATIIVLLQLLLLLLLPLL